MGRTLPFRAGHCGYYRVVPISTLCHRPLGNTAIGWRGQGRQGTAAMNAVLHLFDTPVVTGFAIRDGFVSMAEGAMLVARIDG